MSFKPKTKFNSKAENTFSEFLLNTSKLLNKTQSTLPENQKIQNKKTDSNKYSLSNFYRQKSIQSSQNKQIQKNDFSHPEIKPFENPQINSPQKPNNDNIENPPQTFIVDQAFQSNKEFFGSNAFIYTYQNVESLRHLKTSQNNAENINSPFKKSLENIPYDFDTSNLEMKKLNLKDQSFSTLFSKSKNQLENSPNNLKLSQLNPPHIKNPNLKEEETKLAQTIQDNHLLHQKYESMYSDFVKKENLELQKNNLLEKEEEKQILVWENLRAKENKRLLLLEQMKKRLPEFEQEIDVSQNLNEQLQLNVEILTQILGFLIRNGTNKKTGTEIRVQPSQH